MSLFIVVIILSFLSLAITVFCSMKYIHPSAHLGFKVTEKSKLVHLARFWWWLVTGLNLKEYSAIHRHNHAHSMTKWEDGIPPDSVLVRAKMFIEQRRNKNLIEDYGIESPNTWIDINLYQRYHYLGPVVYLLLLISVLGTLGFIVWIAQSIFIVFLCSESVNSDRDCTSNLCSSELLMFLKTKKYYE